MSDKIMNTFACKCGEETTYGINYYAPPKGERYRDYFIGSCCDGGRGVGCVAADHVKYCPFCGRRLPWINKKLRR